MPIMHGHVPPRLLDSPTCTQHEDLRDICSIRQSLSPTSHYHLTFSVIHEHFQNFRKILKILPLKYFSYYSCCLPWKNVSFCMPKEISALFSLFCSVYQFGISGKDFFLLNPISKGASFQLF